MAKTELKQHYYSPEFKRDAIELVEGGYQTLGLTHCVLQFKNERIRLTSISDTSTQQEDGPSFRESLRLIN